MRLLCERDKELAWCRRSVGERLVGAGERPRQAGPELGLQQVTQHVGSKQGLAF